MNKYTNKWNQYKVGWPSMDKSYKKTKSKIITKLFYRRPQSQLDIPIFFFTPHPVVLNVLLPIHIYTYLHKAIHIYVYKHEWLHLYSYSYCNCSSWWWNVVRIGWPLDQTCCIVKTTFCYFLFQFFSFFTGNSKKLKKNVKIKNVLKMKSKKLKKV